MDYSLNRLTKVITSYIRRNILPGKTREFVILDVTNSYLGRIYDNTPPESIISILGNDFADFISDKFLYSVKEYKEMGHYTVLTKQHLIRGKFTYFWGIQNGKLLCGKLDDLPKDMLVSPVRNWKKKFGRIIDVGCDEQAVSLYFIDDQGNKIRYPQTGNVTKTLLIGPKKQVFLSCNPCWDMREYTLKIKEYLVDNPSYLVLLDNGRFENHQIENINKETYLASGFQNYDDMFVFGELKQ